eukprot:gb/GFBE01068019.1/.p1 GENE.gb/GFBE01068019.1/~~gb/GFBE01068019.1/.p1  ORF type:complete len:571 (+),score=140.95 gb/GFBE01068019.1/:1-1713(+)
MAGSIARFVERLQAAFAEAGAEPQQCHYDEASGQMIVGGETTRVVPVAMLFASYAACADEPARNKLIKAAMEAFVQGAADAPSSYADCGARLLPQLWPVQKIVARQVTLPSGFELPHCGLHGEEAPLAASGEEQQLGVVLVCDYVAEGLPAIETPVLSSDLTRWDVSFVQALQKALDNLRAKTKDGPTAEKRWEHHPTGCGESCWKDRFDAARIALFPKLLTARKRPDGAPESGGHVAAFATPSCVLASTSKNALGLCFMGDTLNVQIAAKDEQTKAKQLLSATPLRLLKMKDPLADAKSSAPRHPLQAKASEGFVWKWLPYSPGGPPLRSPGEFSVPVDQGEVDAILNAAEAGKPVPVFTQKATADKAKASKTFASKKEEGNALFKAGEYVKAIMAYDAALEAGAPSDADAAIAHSNAAQALLNLAAADAPRREACAAEALKRANAAAQLDPTNAKAFARCAAACDVLGEAEAAAEFRERQEGCTAADAATRALRQAEAQKKQKELEERREALQAAKKEKEQREALLERERALERERQQAEESKNAEATSARLSAMLGIDPSLASLGSA